MRKFELRKLDLECERIIESFTMFQNEFVLILLEILSQQSYSGSLWTVSSSGWLLMCVYCCVASPQWIIYHVLVQMDSEINQFGWNAAKKAPYVKLSGSGFTIFSPAGKGQSVLYHRDLEQISMAISQCARTDLNKRFLPKPMTTTGWKETP